MLLIFTALKYGYTSVQLVKILTPVFASLTQLFDRKRCVKDHIAHAHVRTHVKCKRGRGLNLSSFTAIMLSDVDFMLMASDLVIWLFKTIVLDSGPLASLL